jgi:hypothetical protein
MGHNARPEIFVPKFDSVAEYGPIRRSAIAEYRKRVKNGQSG